MNLDLDSSRIDLWCAFVTEVRDEALWSRYQSLMSEEERARQGRFRFARDRRRFLLTRALVRSVLSRYAPYSPAEWLFSVEPNGRPRIAGPGASLPIEFNISHAGDLVAVAVTGGGRLGVDVEDFLDRKADIDGLHRYFARSESARLLELSPAARRQRFFELWTLKESYLKARGVGLAVPLGAFAFDFPGPRDIRLSIDRDLGDSPERWGFWQLALRSRYLAALCAERRGDGPRRIRVRVVVPLHRDQEVEVPMLRSTEPA